MSLTAARYDSNNNLQTNATTDATLEFQSCDLLACSAGYLELDLIRATIYNIHVYFSSKRYFKSAGDVSGFNNNNSHNNARYFRLSKSQQGTYYIHNA